MAKSAGLKCVLAADMLKLEDAPPLLFNKRLHIPTILLIPLTSQQAALRFAGTVLVEPDEQNGLRQPSVALVFQLTAVDKKFINARIGMVSTIILKEIWSTFDELTGRR